MIHARLSQPPGIMAGGRARSDVGAQVPTVALALALLVGSGAGAGSQDPRGWGGAIIVGSVMSLSGQPLNNVQTRRAYEFWAELTNEDGGILVNGTRHRVELRVRDDKNNATLRRLIMFELARDVHVIFGGRIEHNKDMADATAAHGIPGIVAAGGEVQLYEGRPLLFGVGGSPSLYPIQFLDAAYEFGARRVALVTNVDQQITVDVCSRPPPPQ